MRIFFIISRQKRDKPSDGPRRATLTDIEMRIFFYDFMDTRVKIFFMISGCIKILYLWRKQEEPGDDPRM
jgi:hypothetical protein